MTSGITSLPSSIGQLQSLQVLDLSYTKKLTSLPEEIGKLCSLIKLILRHSDITSLFPSIGRLQSLQVLDLCYTTNLSSLPEDTGNLGSLIKLFLRRSDITSLPSSIGQLKNLQVLDLSYTKKLKRLPGEIGNLCSLIELFLRTSGITSLPSSIGQLQSLQVLDISYTEKLTSLPEEIRMLPKLVELDFWGRRYKKFYPLAVSTLYFNRRRQRLIQRIGIPFKAFFWPIILKWKCCETIHLVLVDRMESFIIMLRHGTKVRQTTLPEDLGEDLDGTCEVLMHGFQNNSNVLEEEVHLLDESHVSCIFRYSMQRVIASDRRQYCSSCYDIRYSFLLDKFFMLLLIRILAT